MINNEINNISSLSLGDKYLKQAQEKAGWKMVQKTAGNNTTYFLCKPSNMTLNKKYW